MKKKLTTLSILLCIIVTLCYTDPVYITKSGKYHIVKKGDTVHSISKKYGIPKDKLISYNSIKNNKIIIGQKIYFSPKENTQQMYVTQQNIPESGVHVVKKGETIYRISKMYGISEYDLMDFNKLDSFTIFEGQKLKLVGDSGAETEEFRKIAEKDNSMYHVVEKKETLYGIARIYKTTVSEIKELNNLDSNNIYVGQKLKLRGTAPAETSETAKVEAKTGTGKKAAAKKVQGKVKSVSAAKVFLPVKGTVTSEFGLRNGKPHKGIDIAAKIGTPIHAALAGKVVYEGVQKGYGNVIILEHKGSIMTVYAHNESNLVRLGDTVTKGQPIATLGSTGRSSGAHLHFEYRIKGKAINPRKVLGSI